jgi:hypothetical protein
MRAEYRTFTDEMSSVQMSRFLRASMVHPVKSYGGVLSRHSVVVEFYSTFIVTASVIYYSTLISTFLTHVFAASS